MPREFFKRDTQQNVTGYKMKVDIDREGCIGCGVCEALCPEVFHLVEDGKSGIIEKHRKGSPGEGEVGSELVACVESARDSCPVCVIKTE
jgi:ferredoxin